jgi:hypothetical protein
MWPTGAIIPARPAARRVEFPDDERIGGLQNLQTTGERRAVQGGTGFWDAQAHVFMELIFRPETYPLRDKFGRFTPPDVIDL